jgi:hypothetical protein
MAMQESELVHVGEMSQRFKSLSKRFPQAVIKPLAEGYRPVQEVFHPFQEVPLDAHAVSAYSITPTRSLQK